jgi:hypothetical protein
VPNGKLTDLMDFDLGLDAARELEVPMPDGLDPGRA